MSIDVTISDDVRPVTVYRSTTIDAALTMIWHREFGPKARKIDRPILQTSIGLRRLTRFLAEVKAELGIVIPPTAFLRLGTVGTVARAIEAGIWPQVSPLVLLKDGDPGKSFYLVSAGSGLMLELCDLAMLIDFPGQIWGLQLPGLDGEAKPLTRVENIADLHVKAILERHPGGPIHIAGYSFGGLVTIEMARRLQAAGHNLGLVGLLDSGCYEKYWPRLEWLKFSIKRTCRRLAEAREMPLRDSVAHMTSRIVAFSRHLKRRLESSAVTPTVPSQSIFYIGGLEPDFQLVRDSSIVAFEAYKPSSTDCKVILFKSDLGDPHSCDPAGIWRPLVAGLQIVIVPGSHTTMVRRPHARTLGCEIMKYTNLY